MEELEKEIKDLESKFCFSNIPKLARLREQYIQLLTEEQEQGLEAIS